MATTSGLTRSSLREEVTAKRREQVPVLSATFPTELVIASAFESSAVVVVWVNCLKKGFGEPSTVSEEPRTMRLPRAR